MFLVHAASAVFLITAVIISAIFYYMYSIKFGKIWDKIMKQESINKDFQSAGFAYDRKAGCFYLLENCGLRKAGHTALVDYKVQLVNRIMHSEPVRFKYADKIWMIEIWKGQYGIFTGAEVGIYHAPGAEEEEIESCACRFEAAGRPEMLPVSFVLRRKREIFPSRKVLLKRKGVHWRLSGFLPGEYSLPGSLDMDIKIKFPNKEMRNAFIHGLEKLGYIKGEYAAYAKTAVLHFGIPYSVQPLDGKYVHKAVILKKNRENCKIYKTAGADMKDTLDKLEYLKKNQPDVYKMLGESLCLKEAYDRNPSC